MHSTECAGLSNPSHSQPAKEDQNEPLGCFKKKKLSLPVTRVFPQTHGDKDAENQALGCLHLTVKMTQRQTHSGALMLRLLTASGNPLPGLEDEGPAKGP